MVLTVELYLMAAFVDQWVRRQTVEFQKEQEHAVLLLASLDSSSSIPQHGQGRFPWSCAKLC